MKKALVFGVTVALAFAAGLLVRPGTETQAGQADAVYVRVMKTQTLRCGYFIEAPFTLKDPNTGKLSGLAVDLTEAVGRELGLKIEWVEEINFATMADDLKNGRYDMVCSDVFVLPRAGRIDYARPFSFARVYGYTKPGDKRFSGDIESVDWKQMTISGLDNEGATIAARKLLPEAKFDILPQLSQISQMLMEVSSSKADIAFVMPSVFDEFDQANPGKLVRSDLNGPLYVYATAFAVPAGALQFKAMIDNTLTQMEVSGELGRLRTKYDPKGYFKPE